MKLLTYVLYILICMSSVFAEVSMQGNLSPLLVDEFSIHINSIRKSSHKIKGDLFAYDNTYELYVGLLKFIDNTTNDCSSEQDNEKLEKCYKDYINKYSKKSLKLNYIDKVIYNKLKESTNLFHIENNEITFFDAKEKKKIDHLQAKFKDEIDNDPLFLQKRNLKKYNNLYNRTKRRLFGQDKTAYEQTTLSSYLKLKNRFRFVKYNKLSEFKIDTEFESSLKKIYFRKSKKIGRLNPIEYIFLNYNTAEINKMSELLTLTTKMLNAKAGEIVLAHVDYTDIFYQIEQIEGLILNQTVEMSNTDDETIRKNIFVQIEQNRDEVYRLRKEVTFFDLKEKIENLKKEKEKYINLIADENIEAKRKEYLLKIKTIDSMINSIHEEIAKLSTKIPLTHKDIYNFSISYLKLKLKEETINKTFNITPSFGDVVISSYLAGDIDDNLFKSILEMPEMKENHKGTLKQIGNIALGVGRIIGMSNPIIGPYVTLGFVVFDSIKNKKRMEKEMADETSIIANPFN